MDVAEQEGDSVASRPLKGLAFADQIGDGFQPVQLLDQIVVESMSENLATSMKSPLARNANSR